MDTGYRVHTVGPGDTIQAIGDVYGVDWTQIVTMNGLVYPYINTEMESGDNSHPPGVATIGRKLAIPTGALMFPVKTNDGTLDLEPYIMGTDLDCYTFMESEHHVVRLGEDGELTDNGAGDLFVAKGIRNLRQQLITRLGTPRGTLLLHPEYGSDLLTYIGKATTPELLTDIKLCVQECLLKDFRVKGISDLRLESRLSSIFIDVLIHAIEPFGVFRLLADFSQTGTTITEV